MTSQRNVGFLSLQTLENDRKIMENDFFVNQKKNNLFQCVTRYCEKIEVRAKGIHIECNYFYFWMFICLFLTICEVK